MSFPPVTYYSTVLCYAVPQVAKRVGPTELPQTVAAFHSLVGLAATGTAIGDYMHHMHDPAAVADAVRMSSVYLASFIGGATATGSVVAFGKLQVVYCFQYTNVEIGTRCLFHGRFF